MLAARKPAGRLRRTAPPANYTALKPLPRKTLGIFSTPAPSRCSAVAGNSRFSTSIGAQTGHTASIPLPATNYAAKKREEEKRRRYGGISLHARRKESWKKMKTTEELSHLESQLTPERHSLAERGENRKRTAAAVES